MKLGEKGLTKEMQRMKGINKIDGLVGADNVGLIIDHFNQLVDKKKEKDFAEDMTDRNKYYWKLWKRVADEVERGARTVKNLKPRKGVANVQRQIRN